MRIRLTVALIATLVGSGVALAAPASMMQTMNKACPAPDDSPGAWGWAKKWFGGGSSEPPVANAPRFAYAPNQPATSAGGVPGSMYGAAAPNSATYAPRPQLPSLAGVAPAFTTAEPTDTRPVGFAPRVAEQSVAPVSESQPAARSTFTSKQFRDQGHALDRAGELVAAEGFYRQAIGADPTDPAALNDLGICLARQGKLDASAAMLRQAISIRPEKPLYRNNLATVLVEMGGSDEALANLESVYRPAVAHFNLGQLLLKAGKASEAAEEYKQAVNMEPSLAAAEQALARLKPPAEPQIAAAAPAATPTLAVPPSSPPTQVAVPRNPEPVEQPTPAPQPTLAAPTAAPAYRAGAPYRSALVPAASVPTMAPTTQPTPVEPVGVPSFPRLLPPVLDR